MKRSGIFFLFILLIIISASLYQITGCGTGGGGGSSSSGTSGGNVSGSAKYYINVTLKFSENTIQESQKNISPEYNNLIISEWAKNRDCQLSSDYSGQTRFSAPTHLVKNNKTLISKLCPDLEYYEVWLLKAETNEQIGETKRVDRPQTGSEATVTFFDVPEGNVQLVVKGYSTGKVIVGESESTIDVSLASVTGSGSGGSGGGSLSGENNGLNNEPIVLPTGTVVNGPSAPKITSVEPKKIAIGETVTIRGSGFGERRKSHSDSREQTSVCESFVYFGGVKATEYIFWSDTYIVCRVPKNATLSNLNVCVSVGGGSGGAMISASSGSATVVTVVAAPSGGGGGGGGGAIVTYKKLYGGSSIDQVNSICSLSDTGVIYVGSSSSSNGDLAGIGAHGGYDGWIMKLDSYGNVVWKKLYGGSAVDYISSIFSKSDGSIICSGPSQSSDGDLAGLGAHGSNDGWIMKLDSNGNVVWKKLYGGSVSDIINSVCGLSDGGILLTGYSTSSDGDLAGLGAHGGYDGWIMKLDSNGNVVWKKLYGGSTTDLLFKIFSFSDSSLIYAGYSSSSDGDLAGLGAHGNSDGWVVKLDSGGNVLWKKLFGGSGDEQISSICSLSDSGIVCTGQSQSSDGDLAGLGAHGNWDGWMIKLDSSGNVVWKKLYGGSGDDGISMVNYLQDGGIIFTGSSTSSDGDLSSLGAHGSNDGWIMKLNSTGGL